MNAHLERVAALLADLSAQKNPNRAARALAQELLLFRNQFATRDQTALGL